MDVNETLRLAREAMVDIYNSPGGEGGDRLAELFGTLDEWLSRGGFLPFDWGMAGPGSITRMPEGTTVPTEG